MVTKRAFLLLSVLLLSGLLITGCGDDAADETDGEGVDTTATTEGVEDQEGDTPTTESDAAGDDTAFAEEVWEEIQEADYQSNWTSSPKGEKYPGLPPHGAFVSLYLDEAADPALEEPPGEMPDGSILVKENWMDEETLGAFTVMVKRADYDDQTNDWFFARYTPDGQIEAAGAVEGCATCHRAVESNDYVFSFPVNPAEASDGDDPDAQSHAEDLWSQLQEADYRASYATTPKGEKYPGLEPHGALISLYLDENAAGVLDQPPGEMPDGSIVVKENWTDEQDLGSVTVMEKRAGYSSEQNDWFFAQYDSEGEVQAAGQVGGCAGCHAAVNSNDYIFTFPVNVQ
jgi:hypothetical protein